MTIRTIEWTIGSNMKVTPTTVQDAGVQGEHKATTLVFKLPNVLADGHVLTMVYIDTAGGVDYSPELTIEWRDAVPTVSYELPKAWSQQGGEGTIRLLAEKQNTGEEVYSFEGHIRFDNRSTRDTKIKTIFEQTMRKALLEIKRLYDYTQVEFKKIQEAWKTIKEDAAAAIKDANAVAVHVDASAAAARNAADSAAAAKSQIEQAVTTAEEAVTAAEEAVTTATGIVDDFALAVDDAERLPALKKMMEINKGSFMSLWIGTKEEYEEQQDALHNVFCIITNDGTMDEVEDRLKSHDDSIRAIWGDMPYQEYGDWEPELKCVKFDGTEAVDPTVEDVQDGLFQHATYSIVGGHIYISCIIHKRLLEPGDGYAIISGLPYPLGKAAAFSSYCCYGAISENGDDGFVEKNKVTFSGYAPCEFIGIQSPNGLWASKWKLKETDSVEGSNENDIYIGFSGVYEM